MLGFVIVEPFGGFRQRVLVDHTIGKQHVIHCLAAMFRHGGQQFLAPDLFDGETLGEFHDLPDIRLGLARGFDLLPPKLGAALGVAIGAFFFDPHGGGQDQVSRQRGYGRIGVRYGDKVFRVAIARIAFFVHIRCRLHVIGALHPICVQVAVFQLAVLQHGVEAGFGGDGACGLMAVDRRQVSAPCAAGI